MLLQQRLTSSRMREGQRLLETLEKGGGVGGRSRGRELLSILATKEEEEKHFETRHLFLPIFFKIYNHKLLFL